MKPNQSGSHQPQDGSYPMMGGEYMAAPGQQYFPQQQQQQANHFQQYPSAGPPMMFPPGMQQPHGGMPSVPSQQSQPPQYHFPQQLSSGQQGSATPSYGAGQYFIDAACTVPAGQLSQQPQLLHQMPQGEQAAAFPGATTTRACSNPNCKHCGINGGKPHSRR
ncbi:calcium-binding protein P-like [Culex pipiens pallens]|uniref:calcium-binding protein P-like n=1 Tax=Culex pipiens pallens TaxID=42434 RepID=UPI0019537772|nr:calcium-binding protein P-like [Culex pipiens pallens]